MSWKIVQFGTAEDAAIPPLCKQSVHWYGEL
jgi:hypothetical protein